MAVVVVAWSVALTGHAQPVTPASEHVWVQRGAAPIVITAPHGGEDRLPEVSARQTGARAQDARTRELAFALLAELEARHGLRPHGVVALFHRRYLDANRPPSLAFEQASAAPHYAAYHAAVRAAVDQVRGQFPQGGLLIDLHGQARDPDVIHRGTQNGATMQSALTRFGPAALTGPASVFGVLGDHGYAVYPPNDALGAPRESPEFNGGYTVQTYGSHRERGIDALQIELGATHRASESVAAVAAALADAIATYAADYLVVRESARAR